MEKEGFCDMSFDKRKLGRDPGMGRVSFKTGVISTRKQKMRNRKSKHSRRELSRQLDNR